MLWIKPGAACMLASVLVNHIPSPISFFIASPLLFFFKKTIFLLTLWECHTVHFDHRHSLLNSSQVHPTSLPTQLHVLLFFWANLCNQILLGVGPAWNMVHLPNVTSLKKMDSPSSRSYQMSIALHLGVGLPARCPHCMLGFCLTWAYEEHVDDVIIVVYPHV